MAILVFSPNGTHVAKPTLEAARTSADCAGKTVVVTSALTAAQSDITAAWPADRALEVKKGGSIANTVAFTINGPFTAGLYQVFAGSGSVTGLTEAQPEWFGAKGDGITDDAVAIDNALNAVTNGTLYLSGKTYLVGTFSTRADVAGSMIAPKSGVSIVGTGDTSVIKAKAGLSPALSWSFIYTKAELLTNCIFRDFKIDGGTNLNTSDYPATTNRAIGSDAGGYNILIDNVTFTNMPGNNPVAFSGSTGTRGLIVVNNCCFTEMGSGKPGNYSVDHSDIYIAGYNNKVTNNYFASTNFVLGAPWEFHGDLGEAYGNYVSGYRSSFFIAPNGQNITHSSVHDNVFVDVSSTGFLSPNGVESLGDIDIHNNTFTMHSSLTPTVVGFAFSGSQLSGSPAGTLSIKGNKFYGHSGDKVYLIQTGYAKNLIFQNNYAENFYRCVHIDTSGDVLGDTYTHHTVNISGNSFSNCVSTAISSDWAATNIKTLVINGNSMDAESVVLYNPPVVFLGTVTCGKISGNETSNYDTYMGLPSNIETDYVYSATVTLDPPSLAAGASYTTNVSLNGVPLGGKVDVTTPYDMQGVMVYGYVQSYSHIYVVFFNATAAPVDLGSGIFKVQVRH